MLLEHAEQKIQKAEVERDSLSVSGRQWGHIFSGILKFSESDAGILYTDAIALSKQDIIPETLGDAYFGAGKAMKCRSR